MWFKKMNLTKSEFFKKIKKLGIKLQVHYIPVYLQPFYKKNYGFKLGDFPVSESFYSNEVSLPIYVDLSIKEQEKTLENIFALINVKNL